MPSLVQNAASFGEAKVVNAIVNQIPPSPNSKSNSHWNITGVLKATAAAVKLFPASNSSWVDRGMDMLANAADTYNRIVNPNDKQSATERLASKGELYNVFPGYMAVYVNGKLDNIIPFQYEAKILSDVREASYESMDYGVNEISVYNKTALRKINLTTTYATLDPSLYSTHYVEGKVREIQSLVYAGSGSSSEMFTESVQRDITAPPLIGLFIGDKFMRRKLPRMVYDDKRVEKLVVEDLLDVPGIKQAMLAPGSRQAIESVLMFAFAEPIYWRVDSVDVNWDDSPYNVDFSQANINLIPGQSRLPMFQRVTMALTEHRAPSVFERRRDVDSFSTPHNLTSRTIL